MSIIKQPTTYKWRIDNFSKKAARDMQHSRSDDFVLTGSDVRCWLEFHPTYKRINGFHGSKRYSAIVVGSNYFMYGLAETLDFKLWLECSRGGSPIRPSTTVERLDDTRRVGCDIMEEDVIYSGSRSLRTIFTDDIVCVCCEIGPKKAVVVEKKSLSAHQYSIHEKLLSLQKQGVSGACTIHVGEKTFTLDKIFLMAHSDVFERMFTSDMKEAKTGVVEIADFSAELMQIFVDYVYSLKVKNIDAFSEDLYILASKYEVSELKDQCTEHLIKTLDKSNIIGRFILAFVHDHEKLKETILKYLTKPGTELDFSAILASDEWKEFQSGNSQLANEILKIVHGKVQLTLKA